MEEIKLPKFLSYFGCMSVNDCWLSTDCIIDESGITARHYDNDSIERMMYSQYIKLDFPCTEQRLYEWARSLDDWKMKHPDTGNQSHCVEKLLKELLKELGGKWQPASDFFRNWCYWQGAIKAKIGSAPFGVDWAHWLTLSTWTKEEAALLVSGFEPDKFYRVECHADYQGMCEPLIKLLRLIPDDLHLPLGWLTWFYENGYLYYAPERLQVWHEEQRAQHENVSNLAEAAGYDGAVIEGKRDKQINFICETAKMLNYHDLMNIPEGGKAAIKTECLKNTVLFTNNGFIHAWKEANKRKVISMQDKEKYL